MSPDSRARRVRAEVLAVEEILRRWDPIGVLPGLGDDEGPMDEYDSYAPHVLGLMQRGAGTLEIGAHLSDLRTRQMGLPPSPQSDSRFAAELMTWWSSRSLE